jgi:hypothetical protein
MMSGDSTDYRNAYSMWHAVWSETFWRNENLRTLYSDDFNRQHEIICIFKENICLGILAFRWVDCTLESVQNDSYFRAWPKESVQQLALRGRNLMITSNLTVHPLARNKKLGLPIKDI